MNNGETRRDALKRLGLAIVVGGAATVGVDILASPEAKAENRVEAKKAESEISTVSGENLNKIHTEVYDKFITKVGKKLKTGSFVMSNFRIKLSKSGKEFTLVYSVDLTPIDKASPNVQDAFQVVGTILRDKKEVQASNQAKKADWIKNNKGTQVSRFWEELAETECDGWYHQAIIFKAKSK